MSSYVQALANALAYIQDQRDALQTKAGLAGHDGVVIAAELMGHSAAICEAYAAEFNIDRPADRMTGEAGYLAGYWQTIGMLQSLTPDWITAERLFLSHAEAILVDEIASNTLPR